MGGSLQTLLVSVGVFTITVLLLALFVLGLRRLLTPVGTAMVVVNDQRRLQARLGTRLHAVLADSDIYLPAACGGRGACGQCRLRLHQGAPPLTAVEAAHIPSFAARAGDRLACMVTVWQDVSVQVPAELLAVKRWRSVVRSSRHVTTLMKEIVLQLPDSEAMGFQAGNYALVEAPPHHVEFRAFDIPPAYRAEWERNGLLELVSSTSEPALRAYSLANPPAQNDRAVLTVRIALPPHDQPPDTPPGQASSWLFSLSEGDEVPLTGPYGDFHARDTEREMILIGGGAGIAPLRSIILDQLEGRRSRRRIGFWYGARNVRELCYREEFDQLAHDHPNFSWHAVLSEPDSSGSWDGPTGFVHAAVHASYLADHPAPYEVEYYVCGPPLMNLAVIQMLEDLDVDRESIFLDDFGAAI